MTQEQFDRKYHAGYYETNVSPRAEQSAEVIAETIVELFNPESVVDVGCGTGELLNHFKARSLRVSGLDRSSAALEGAIAKDIPVKRWDLEQKPKLDKLIGADVVICMEVAEHVSEDAADDLLRLLAHLSDNIVFTAAYPGQGGNGHINEQPKEYWIEKFRKYGRHYDSLSTEYLQKVWRQSGTVVSWYWRNLMIFRKPRAEYWKTANKDRTICEVLREIWELTEKDEIKTLLHEAQDMAKRMAYRLMQYNKQVFSDFWAENKDYEEDLRSRIDKNLIPGVIDGTEKD